MINIKNYAKSILITFGILLVVIVAYGFILSRAHGFIQMAFWWLTLPVVICYISSRFKNVNFLANALASVLLLFSFLYFMTYKQMHTDFGYLLKSGFIVNSAIIILYYLFSLVPDRVAGKSNS